MGTAARPFPNQQWHFNASDGSLRTQLQDAGAHKGKGACVTSAADGSLSTAPCAQLSSQGFAYDAATQQLTTTADGRCLTAAAPSPPRPPPAEESLAIGKPLHDGSVALLLLNNQASRGNVTCDTACFGRLGFGPAHAVSVRDVWAHTMVGQTTGAKGWAAELDANGASALLILRAS